MFGRILDISDNTAIIENKKDAAFNGDLLNLHLIFENGDHRVLGEIVKLEENRIEVKFLGEYDEKGHYANGILRKANINSNIRTINSQELLELIGQKSKDNFVLGKCAMYKNFDVCPIINDLFANHMCIFGNSGSGKSCGVARIVQNILSNDQALAYNANLIFFDSFGEYKNAFKNVGAISEFYNYKFITCNPKDADDELIQIPLNLLTVDDYAILLQAEKHSQLTIIQRALKYARIFSTETERARQFKNSIIANALMTILYSNNTIQKKKDDIFTIIDTCHTPEFNFDTVIPGVGYSRTFSECFVIDSRGHFGEEVLITEYILKYTSEDETLEDDKTVPFTLRDFAKALDFTLISEGFTENKNMHDDAQLLKVRLNTILNNEVGQFFDGSAYVAPGQFITRLVSNKMNKKAQIININLESLDDAYAKSLVKIYSHIIFEFSKGNANRATVPFHLFLEEAHRYIQKDIDTFLLGYNVFDRIAKEGRKYGVILDIISQRPMEISDTVIAQCSNFLIFKMTHPKDIKYIEEMLPNISQDVIEKMKILQPGTCVAFGSAFKISLICKLEMPNPRPYSSSCDVSTFWDSKQTLQESFGTNQYAEGTNNVNNINASLLNTQAVNNNVQDLIAMGENNAINVNATAPVVPAAPVAPVLTDNTGNNKFINMPASQPTVDPNLSNSPGAMSTATNVGTMTSTAGSIAPTDTNVFGGNMTGILNSNLINGNTGIINPTAPNN